MLTPFRDDEASIPVVLLARRIGWYLGTVHAWRKSGMLECVRVGGRWVVPAEAWGRFNERYNPPRPPLEPRSNERPKRPEMNSTPRLWDSEKEDAHEHGRCSIIGMDSLSA